MQCTLPCPDRRRYLRMLTSMGWALAPETLRMNSSMPFSQNLYTSTWMSRMDSHITKTLGDFATRLAEMEKICSSLTARLCKVEKVETFAASASNVSGSARSWPTLEQVDGSTAAGSHGPGSSDDNRNTRRRLDTSSSTEDEQSRSAVLFRFPCEQRDYKVDRYPLGGVQFAGMQQTCQNSLQSRIRVSQACF